jgi:hypothetical protein
MDSRTMSLALTGVVPSVCDAEAGEIEVFLAIREEQELATMKNEPEETP